MGTLDRSNRQCADGGRDIALEKLLQTSAMTATPVFPPLVDKLGCHRIERLRPAVLTSQRTGFRGYPRMKASPHISTPLQASNSRLGQGKTAICPAPIGFIGGLPDGCTATLAPGKKVLPSIEAVTIAPVFAAGGGHLQCQTSTIT